MFIQVSSIFYSKLMKYQTVSEIFSDSNIYNDDIEIVKPPVPYKW
jgi:hypothetical protein